jgi:DNA-binding transcriptional LysR family regulator
LVVVSLTHQRKGKTERLRSPTNGQAFVSKIHKCGANDLSTLSVFLTVAEDRSSRGSPNAGGSPSAVIHSMRELEEEIGVRLLSRTTRSVALTDAGEHLRARLRPAITEIREAVGQVSGLRNKPAGRVRLLVPRLAASTVLAPKLGQFARDYPTSCSTSRPIRNAVHYRDSARG